MLNGGSWRRPGSLVSRVLLITFATIRYEMRRDCQEIIPGLLLGPYLVSRDLEKLRKLGISHMYASIQGYFAQMQRCRAEAFDMNSVCLRDAKEAFSVKPRFPEQFVYMTLDVQDTEDQNLIRLFPACVLRLHLVTPSLGSRGSKTGWADHPPFATRQCTRFHIRCD